MHLNHGFKWPEGCCCLILVTAMSYCTENIYNVKYLWRLSDLQSQNPATILPQTEKAADLERCEGRRYCTVETSIHCPPHQQVGAGGKRVQCLLSAVWMFTYSLTRQESQTLKFLWQVLYELFFNFQGGGNAHCRWLAAGARALKLAVSGSQFKNTQITEFYSIFQLIVSIFRLTILLFCFTFVVLNIVFGVDRPLI